MARHRNRDHTTALPPSGEDPKPAEVADLSPEPDAARGFAATSADEQPSPLHPAPGGPIVPQPSAPPPEGFPPADHLQAQHKDVLEITPDKPAEAEGEPAGPKGLRVVAGGVPYFFACEEREVGKIKASFATSGLSHLVGAPSEYTAAGEQDWHADDPANTDGRR